MKQHIKRIIGILALGVLLFPVGINAQEDAPKKPLKREKKAGEQIIIRTTGDKKEKIVVEINGDKVTVNGKDVNDLKDEDIEVIRNKFNGIQGFSMEPGEGGWKMDWDMRTPMAFSMTSDNRALLGVVTEKEEDGVTITDVTEGSAAEKSGLKEGDIILKVDDAKIEEPGDLTRVIRAHKPGDKVNVTFKRGKKEETVKAELGKAQGVAGVYNYDIQSMMPAIRDLEKLEKLRAPMVQGFGENFNFVFPDDQRLGLSVQDTEDGKGVKVLEVDDESNAAKAGIAVDDIILEFGGKTVNAADELARSYREKLRAKEAVVKVKLLRGGKEKDLEIKVPRKLKTAEL